MVERQGDEGEVREREPRVDRGLGDAVHALAAGHDEVFVDEAVVRRVERRDVDAGRLPKINFNTGWRVSVCRGKIT